MAQYSKIFIINKLQSLGLTAWLYKLGVANGKILQYASAYNYMVIQEKLAYSRAEAIKRAATKCKISRRSMYNVTREMEQLVDVPEIVEKVLSIKLS